MHRPTIFLYRAIRKLAALAQTSGPTGDSSCVVWPPVRTEDEMGRLGRWLSWYFPSQSDLRIILPVRRQLRGGAKSAACWGLRKNVRITNWPDAQGQAGTVLLHRTNVRNLMWAAFRFRTYIQSIDPNFWNVEESLAFENIFRRHQTQSLAALRNRLTEISLKNYTDLFHRYHGCERAFVFATGPSLHNAFKLRLPDDELTIISNSLVKYRELLDHIQPKILTFADQVFHFGPSEYAFAFRRDAVNLIQKYRCKFIVPPDRALLLALHHPEIVNYLIAMPLGPHRNFPRPEKLYVEPTDNIMTLFMIPVASALARNIYFCGADGRTPKEDYFWRYDNRAQYSSLLPTAVEWHPSFFRDRDIDTYYKNHCETLEQQLVVGEERGIHYFSLTKSQIPALAQRYTEDPLDGRPPL